MKRLFVFYIFILLVFSPAVLLAQAVHIKGTLVDREGNPLADAHVAYLRGSEEMIGQATADENGDFDLVMLPAGIWEKSGIIPICPSPNPFTDSTIFSVFLTSPGWVTISDKKGNEITGWDLERPGEHRITWGGLDQDSKKVSAGVYLIEVTAENYEDTKEVVYLASGEPSQANVRYIKGFGVDDTEKDLIRFTWRGELHYEMKVVFPMADTNLGRVILVN